MEMTIGVFVYNLYYEKTTTLLLVPILGFGQVQIGDDIDRETSNYMSGRSVSLSSDGTIAAIGSPKHAGWRS